MMAFLMNGTWRHLYTDINYFYGDLKDNFICFEIISTHSVCTQLLACSDLLMFDYSREEGTNYGL